MKKTDINKIDQSLDKTNINQGKTRNHINGIENFWGLAKVKPTKFRGMNENTFNLHLKECEFRFTYRNSNIYKLLVFEACKRPLN